MDRQHRPGGKAGSVGMASSQDANVELRERLRKLALETIDLKKDPYFLRNHIGTYECRLCLTVHTNEGSYLAHTQGKKHQTNLARRQAKDAQNPTMPITTKKNILKPKIIKIGRPGYKVVKHNDPDTGVKSITFEVQFQEIQKDFIPRYRIMSSYEQKVEIPEKHYQYVVFAGEPYDNIAFKIPNWEIDQKSPDFRVEWNEKTKNYFLRVVFKNIPAPVQFTRRRDYRDEENQEENPQMSEYEQQQQYLQQQYERQQQYDKDFSEARFGKKASDFQYNE